MSASSYSAVHRGGVHARQTAIGGQIGSQSGAICMHERDNVDRLKVTAAPEKNVLVCKYAYTSVMVLQF